MTMKIGILGSGIVGKTLAHGLFKLDYSVMIGPRDRGKLDDWAKGRDLELKSEVLMKWLNSVIYSFYASRVKSL